MHSAVATADHFTGAGNPAADNANMRLGEREICQPAGRLGKIYAKQYFFGEINHHQPIGRVFRFDHFSGERNRPYSRAFLQFSG
jgi:hypothetical protein